MTEERTREQDQHLSFVEDYTGFKHWWSLCLAAFITLFVGHYLFAFLRWAMTPEGARVIVPFLQSWYLA